MSAFDFCDLISHIKDLQNLKEINVDDSKWNDDCSLLFLHHLQTNGFPSLSELTLRYPNLEAPSLLYSTAKDLKRNDRNILVSCSDSVTSSGFSEIARLRIALDPQNPYRDIIFEHFLLCLKRMVNITYLTFEKFNPNEAQLNAIFEIFQTLKESPTIVTNEAISESDIQRYCLTFPNLRFNTGLENEDLYLHSKPKKITKIDFSNLDANTEAYANLLSFMARRFAKSQDLSFNSVLAPFENLKEIIFKNNQLGEEKLCDLLSSLSKTPLLEQLTINGESWNLASVNAFAASLAENHQVLLILDFQHSHFEEDSLALLLQEIEKLPKCNELHFSHSTLNLQDCQALAEFLARRHKYCEISLNSCSLTDEHVEKLGQIKPNYKGHRLSLKDNTFSPQILAKILCEDKCIYSLNSKEIHDFLLSQNSYDFYEIKKSEYTEEDILFLEHFLSYLPERIEYIDFCHYLKLSQDHWKRLLDAIAQIQRPCNIRFYKTPPPDDVIPLLGETIQKLPFLQNLALYNMSESNKEPILALVTKLKEEHPELAHIQCPQ